MGRYYRIVYEGRHLMSLWAENQRQALDKAKREYQRTGIRGMNLARLEAE